MENKDVVLTVDLDVEDISKAMKEIKNTFLERSKSIKSAFASLNQNLGALQVFCAKIPPRACGLVGMTRRVRSRIKLGKGNSMKLKGRRFQLRRSVLCRQGYILANNEGSGYNRNQRSVKAMICPYCDSLIRDLSDNRVCPFCGAPLSQDVKQAQEKQKLVFPTPPVGIYENHVGHHIEINEDAVIFRKRPGLGGRLSIVEEIPYSELYAVSIARPGQILSGFLSVRSKKRKYYPLPTKITKAIDDDMSISLSESDYSRFYKVYDFLRQCVDIVSANDQ